MKKEQIALLILLGAVCHAIAQQQTSAQASAQMNAGASQTNATASATIIAAKAKFHLFGPAWPTQQPAPLTIEGLDTRAWTTVAETRTSREAFPSGETHGAGLCLIWWGSEPQNR